MLSNTRPNREKEHGQKFLQEKILNINKQIMGRLMAVVNSGTGAFIQLVASSPMMANTRRKITMQKSLISKSNSHGENKSQFFKSYILH